MCTEKKNGEEEGEGGGGEESAKCILMVNECVRRIYVYLLSNLFIMMQP